MKKLMIVLIAALTALSICLVLMAGSIILSRKQPEPAPAGETVRATEAFPPVPAEQPPTVPEEAAASVPPVTESPRTAPSQAVPETTVPSSPPVPAEKTLYAMSVVNVRQGPGTSYSLVGKLQPGEAVLQLSAGEDGWSKIQFRQRDGYVATRYLSENKPQIPQAVFTDSAKTRYASASLHVRSGPGTEYEKIGYFDRGDPVHQLAISDTGWARINYNGRTAYVSASYLQDSQDSLRYQPVDEVVYATEFLHIRSGPGTEYEVIGSLRRDESARRTAIGDNGWSKLRLNDREAYASSKYLTTRVPGSEEMQPEYKITDETMVAAAELTLRRGPGKDYESLGTLRRGSLVHRTAVGNNGWSIILLSGREVFVESALLEPEKEPEKPVVPPAPTGPQKPADPLYRQVNELVETTDVLNVRTGPGKNYRRIGKLPQGTRVRRVGIGSNGWSVILYQEQQAYVSSEYLKTVPENQTNVPTYQKVDETVWAQDSVNVRSGPGTEYETMGNLFYGDEIRRVGIGDNHWSQVIFANQMAYAYSMYLTTEKPEEPDFGDTTTPDFPTPNSPFIYQYVDDPDLIPFAAFEPVSTSGEDPLPMIISLHGSAEVKKSREYMEQQHLTKVFREWEYTGLQPFDAYVICPHIGKDAPFQTWGTPEGANALFRLIDYLKEVYNVDESRILLEGHSMGGQGALYLAADPRACFRKLVVVSGLETSADYHSITIPTMGAVGGAPDSDGPRDSPGIYWFMTHNFRDCFGEDSLYIGPYTHDDVAIKFFQKDEDGNGRSDIIEWMLQN